MARKDAAGAELFWQHALRLDATNTTTVRRLAGLYQAESPARVMQFISTLPAGQQREMAGTLRALRSDSLRAEADALARQKNKWPQAAEKYRAALALQPDDVWLSYRLASALRDGGATQQADAQIATLQQQHPGDATALYAAALYLSSRDNDDAALATLHRLPETQWNSNMHELADRLGQDKIFASAEALRASGQERAAVTLLYQQPVSSQRNLTLADWALARGDAQQALEIYQQVLSGEADNSDAALGRIEALVALQRNSEARQALEQQPAQPNTLNADRRAALAWQAVGETTQAAVRFASLKQRAASLPPSQDKALVFRDA
ncbi:MAG: cellulose biosynthesis protein BcsC, partial [Pantoea agglomerans]|nr:cellulose biosynthesis protein BcsC [Pantoea agglomerans]